MQDMEKVFKELLDAIRKESTDFDKDGNCQTTVHAVPQIEKKNQQQTGVVCRNDISKIVTAGLPACLN